MPKASYEGGNREKEWSQNSGLVIRRIAHLPGRRAHRSQGPVSNNLVNFNNLVKANIFMKLETEKRNKVKNSGLVTENRTFPSHSQQRDL